jgi:hypothetical protein
MPYLVTITNGRVDVMLPSGMRAQGGNVAFLTDDQFSMLSPTGSGNFSSIAAVSGVPTTSLGSQAPVLGDNPYAEGDNEPSTQTPLTSPAIG